MIYILYGQPGSGKTTLSKMLQNHLIKNMPVIIDGDEFRKIFNQTDYSKKGREDNIRSANIVATYISKAQSKDVIMALVNPYEHLRTELKQSCQVIEILLQTNRDLRREYHVEEFNIGNPDIIINTDKSIDTTFKDLISKLNKGSPHATN